MVDVVRPLRHGPNMGFLSPVHGSALPLSVCFSLLTACGNASPGGELDGATGDRADAHADSGDSGSDLDLGDASAGHTLDGAVDDGSSPDDPAPADDAGALVIPGAGEVRLIKRMTSSFDSVVTAPSASTVQWLNEHFYRMEVFSTFFDDKTSFYPNGWVYSDAAVIYVGSDTAKEHPEWILEDAEGQPVYLDWGCSNGSCPQYAADLSNAEFRKAWIESLKATLLKGYKGAWIDDVNLALRFSDGNQEVSARSPTSKLLMTEAVWSHQVAKFMQEVRAALQNYELLHNSIWYARLPKRAMDADVKAQILAADVINLEGGFASDLGLTGGTGEWSVESKLAFADAVHALGRWVVVDDFPFNESQREYSLACYFLLSNGRDGLGDLTASPSAWWPGHDVNLGAALGKRTRSAAGLFRREFEHGLVLMLEPGANDITVTLPKPYRTIAGDQVTSVSLSPRRGAVLLDE
jgi:hypothetical protein